MEFTTTNGNTGTLEINSNLSITCNILGKSFPIIRRAYGFDSAHPLVAVKVVVDRNHIGAVHKMIDGQAKMHPLLRAGLYGEMTGR